MKNLSAFSFPLVYIQYVLDSFERFDSAFEIGRKKQALKGTLYFPIFSPVGVVKIRSNVLFKAFFVIKIDSPKVL